MLAYGELLAFERMAHDTRLAPDLTRRARLSQMAGAEIANYGLIAARLAELGVDPALAMAPFVPALSAYHEQTTPCDWLEALVKAYVGDSIADDFFREIAQYLDPVDRQLVFQVVHDARYAQFAAMEIRAAIADDPKLRDRLSIWARRLVGEGVTQAQRVAAQRPALAGLLALAPAESDPSVHVSAVEQPAATNGVLTLLSRLTAAHTARMAAVGLNN
jgi:hypothetical protein